MDIYVLIGFGLGIFIWSMLTFKKRYKLYKKGERRKGIIKEFRKTEETILETINYTEKVTTYKPIIEIEYNNEKKVFYYDEEIDRKIYATGDEIDIIYDVDAEDIYLDAKIEFFRFPILLFMLSILFFSFSSMLYLFKY